MFETIIMEYLDTTLHKDWSVLEILKIARSVDTFKEFKDDLYAVLQSYSKKCNVHAHARNKVKKSAYTVKALKDQRQNREIISQLRGNDSTTGENSKGADHVQEKVTRPLDVQDDHLCKRQCRHEQIEYLAKVAYDEAEPSSGKQTRQEHNFAPESELPQDHDENNSNELLNLCNSQEESVEYDVEAIRNLLDELETCSQEMIKILSNFRTYQYETRNTLSENGIMDLSPTSELVLLYTEEKDYDKLIKEIFESIDKMFPEKAHEFLMNFFSENLNEYQWEEKLESLMEKGSPEDFCQQSGENPRQDKFITKLKIFMLETLPTFFDAYKLMSENSLKNREMSEEEYMNTFVHPILKKALIRFSRIRYVPGNKAIKASTYRKTIMNQDGKVDRADGIAYTSNQQNSYEISVVEGSKPYVTETNKETSDFIQNAKT